MSGGDCEDAVVEDSPRKVQSVEIQSIKDDPAKIDAMTVQELGTTLRKFGVPAKGRKGNLVSALKHFMAKQIDGESSQEVEGCVSFNSVKNISPQRNTKHTPEESYVVSMNTVSLFQRFLGLDRVREG